ncbi:MAG: hypothetical protein OEZ43_17300 [Gammaproteobacteria bacterium]|nr:hypothetical protein [Gammaproteobacteria bacterium]
MDLLEHPRYKDRPVLLFFEKYVLDVLGELERKQKKILDELDLQSVFKTKSSKWRDVIAEVLKLSDTITIAILDEWYKYIDRQEMRGKNADVELFTRKFADAYFEDSSNIDVWPDQESLAAAQKRIEEKQRELEKEDMY